MPVVQIRLPKYTIATLCKVANKEKNARKKRRAKKTSSGQKVKQIRRKRRTLPELNEEDDLADIKKSIQMYNA